MAPGSVGASMRFYLILVAMVGAMVSCDICVARADEGRITEAECPEFTRWILVGAQAQRAGKFPPTNPEDYIRAAIATGYAIAEGTDATLDEIRDYAYSQCVEKANEREL